MALIMFALDYLTKTLAIEYLSDEPKKIIGSLLQFKLAFNSFLIESLFDLADFILVIFLDVFHKRY